MEPFWINFSKSGTLSIILGILLPVMGAAAVFMIVRLRRDDSPGSEQDMASYPERVKELSAQLARASSEVEHVLEEMAIVSRARTETFSNLEQRVQELAKNEKELQARVETLKHISLPAAEYFLQAHEKPPTHPARGYILFGLGVLASALVTLVLKLVFNL